MLDQLDTLNADGPFAGRLDLDRVGMYRWSLGDANAIERSVVDERVKAAIDHDGQPFGVGPTQGTTRPFMLMHGAAAQMPPFDDPDSIAGLNETMERLTASTRERTRASEPASTGDWYDITVAGTNHALLGPGAVYPGGVTGHRAGARLRNHQRADGGLL